MTLRIAINGFGRIGRNVLRALYTQQYRQHLQVVAINDLGDSAINAHLLQYDSVHGHFPEEVKVDGESLWIKGDRIAVSAIRNPAELPWKTHQVDVVLECTGLFTERDKAAAHLAAGARKVLISAPAKGADATVVYGVNEQVLTPDMQIISNASCTTNCLAPVAQVLQRELGIEQGLMTTIHAYTNDQNLSDVYHSDLYRARSATQSMIPTKTGAAEAVGIRQGLLNTVHSYTNDQNLLDKAHKDLYRARAAGLSMIPSTTGAAKAIGLVLPELAGRLDGLSVRVPTPNVSLVDLTFVAENAPASVDAINQILREGAQKLPAGVMECNEEALVSCDFNHNPLSSIFDANHTKVSGKLLKVMAWYDNEWGFSNRMLDNCLVLARLH